MVKIAKRMVRSGRPEIFLVPSGLSDWGGRLIGLEAK
jgi:hypothetical protein